MVNSGGAGIDGGPGNRLPTSYPAFLESVGVASNPGGKMRDISALNVKSAVFPPRSVGCRAQPARVIGVSHIVEWESVQLRPE